MAQGQSRVDEEMEVEAVEPVAPEVDVGEFEQAPCQLYFYF